MGKQKKTQEDVIEIDLLQLLKALWKRAWIIVLVALLGCSSAYLGTKTFVQPTYRASFTAYVNNKSGNENTTTVSTSDLSAAQSLVYTYTHILTSRTVLEAAAEQIEADYSYESMSGWVTTDVVDDTEIIEVSVTMGSAKDAWALAEALAEVMPVYVTEIVEGSSVEIIDMPILPDSIDGPNYLKNTMMGGMLGVCLAAAVILLRELLDDTVKDEETLEDRFGVAVIGVIPDVVAADRQGSRHYGGYGKNADAQSGADRKLVKSK